MSKHTFFKIASLAIVLSLGGIEAHAQGAAATRVDTPAAFTGGPAADADPGTELLHNAKVKLTRGEYDTQLSRLPEETRAGFGTNISRVNALLRIMLVDKTLAHDARAAGVDRDPQVRAIIDAETDRILAQAVMDRNVEQWRKEFDARPNTEVTARERWLTQQDKYRSPEQVQVTQILFEVPRHTEAEARALAKAARDKITAGFDMNALAKAESEDTSTAANGGRMPWRSARELDPAFARAAFSLKQVGDLSRPVQSAYGVHLIRLDAKRPGTVRPFDDVKNSIIGELRREYIDQMRSQSMAAIRNDPAIVVNGPAVEALVVRIDPAITKGVLESSPAAGQSRPEATSPAAK